MFMKEIMTHLVNSLLSKPNTLIYAIQVLIAPQSCFKLSDSIIALNLKESTFRNKLKKTFNLSRRFMNVSN